MYGIIFLNQCDFQEKIVLKFPHCWHVKYNISSRKCKSKSVSIIPYAVLYEIYYNVMDLKLNSDVKSTLFFHTCYKINMF